MGSMAQSDYQYGNQMYGPQQQQTQMLPQTPQAQQNAHWNSGVQQPHHMLQQNVHGQQHPASGWQGQGAQQPPPPQQPPPQVNGLMSNQQLMPGQYGPAQRQDAYGARNPATANTNPNQHHPQYAYAIRDGGR
jgi:hypothetical protein